MHSPVTCSAGVPASNSVKAILNQRRDSMFSVNTFMLTNNACLSQNQFWLLPSNCCSAISPSAVLLISVILFLPV